MLDFVPSLTHIEAFEANVTTRKTYVKMIKNVTKRLEHIRKKTKSVVEVIYFGYTISLSVVQMYFKS